jgi:antitoxin YefM
MRIVSYSAFRENLADYMDQVAADRTELHVTRQGGPSVVVLSEEEFASLMETLHLMRSPANAARLNEAIADVEAGRVFKRDDF